MIWIRLRLRLFKFLGKKIDTTNTNIEAKTTAQLKDIKEDIHNLDTELKDDIHKLDKKVTLYNKEHGESIDILKEKIFHSKSVFQNYGPF